MPFCSPRGCFFGVYIKSDDMKDFMKTIRPFWFVFFLAMTVAGCVMLNTANYAGLGQWMVFFGVILFCAIGVRGDNKK